MKNYKSNLKASLLLLLLVMLKPSLYSQIDTLVTTDTLTQYFDRSADMVYHVANNSSAPLYSRYFFGTNQSFNEIAQHYDRPQPTNPNAEIIKVEILGFRMRMAVNQVRGAGPDNIAFHYFNAGADLMPEGEPVASGEILSGGLSGDEFVFMPNNEAIEVTSENGFLIGFETYNGDQQEDDIFVLSNSYCVVSGAANDGFGERRTKVRLPNGVWDSLLDFGPNFSQDPGEVQKLLDCDAYVFPYVRTTEILDLASSAGNINAASFVANIFPNPTTDLLNVHIDNPDKENLVVSISDGLGQISQSKTIGKFEATDVSFDISDLPSGIFFLIIEDGNHKVTQNFLVK